MSTLSFASHLMGGQITARQLSSSQYEITITKYRDTTGIPIATSISVDYYDTLLIWSDMHTVSNNGPTSLFNGVEYYNYIDTVTFPASGVYRITTEDCCRNYAILNMSNPGSESFYLMTELNVDTSGSNSTPVLLNHPVTLAQKYALLQYNPLPYDADGDSMAWVLETPLSQNGDTVAGYTLPTGDPSNPFTLDPQTGVITWMPDSNGHWQASFRIEEFRGGVKIGEIRRDMQFVVVDDTTNYHRAVVNTSGWSTDGAGNFMMTLTPGQTFNLTVPASDADGDLIYLTAQGEPMILSSNAAQFYSVSSTPGTTTGYFSWTPSVAQVREQPYAIAIRTFEFHNNFVFVNDQTVFLRVSSVSSINSISGFTSTGVFPNPSSGSWSLPFELKENASVKAEVIDQSGRFITELINTTMPAGSHLLHNSVDLASGFYLIRLSINDQKAGTYPLMIK